MSRVDPSSAANVDKASISHFHLNLTVDFDRKILSGFVDLRCVNHVLGNERIVLDTNDLLIQAVIDFHTNTPLTFKLEEAHPVFGRALAIDLPSANRQLGSITNIRIHYQTSPTSSACQWLDASQTAGKKYPYLFTQCQAIHCRSLIPIQDSPSNKSTYTASITASAPLVALMSAIQNGKSESLDGKTITYLFEQTVPMPSYLVALAVGALESRKLGPRSNVWSEKETVELGAYEFADTEKFLQAAEAICGPYVWKQYDLLLLPPSFPYGGMENPCLTFVTPTLLAGDRSLVNVVAHEIAHSWTGNLVGCHTWESFWLNEGWTVFVERKIGRRLYGIPHAHLDATSGYKALTESIHHYGEDHAFTCLHCKLDGVDPDDAFSSVPYEKGFNFLFYLEQLVGGETVFDPFTLKYIANFAYKTCTSEQFKAFFLNYFNGKVAKEKLDSIDWDAWLYKPGFPSVPPTFDRSLVDAATNAAKAIFDSKDSKASTDNLFVDISGWRTTQRIVFLEKLQEFTKGHEKEFSGIFLKMDEAYGFTNSGNAEIKFRWAQLAIRSGLLAAHDNISKSVINFLIGQGRMKFVRPLYRDLFTLGDNHTKELAVSTFKANKQNYHSIAQKMVARDLQLE